MSARSVEEHASHISGLLTGLHTLSPTAVPTAEALGRITCSDIASPVDLPLFRNSQMDGYAVDAASVASGSDHTDGSRRDRRWKRKNHRNTFQDRHFAS